MRLAIVGSRGYGALGDVVEFVQTLPLDTVIVSGGGIGVDRTAARAGKLRGMEVVEHLPDYVKYASYYAPLARNEVIAQDSDEMEAFWDGESNGTKDAMDRMKRLGKPVRVHLAKRTT